MGGDGKNGSLGNCPAGSAGFKAWVQQSSGAVEETMDPLFLFFGGLEVRGAAAVGEQIVVGAERSVLGHIFRNAEGHVNPSTASSVKRFVRLFEGVANNPANANNSVVSAPGLAAGVKGFSQNYRSGQVWVQVRNGNIFNAGVNPFR